MDTRRETGGGRQTIRLEMGLHTKLCRPFGDIVIERIHTDVGQSLGQRYCNEVCLSLFLMRARLTASE